MFDYTSLGFYTFDCLCRPVSNLPPEGSTLFVEEFTLAVSGAAGSAAIVAAKHGLSVQAIGGVGQDDMGDWVLDKLSAFDVDILNMQSCAGFSTSSSIVTTRPDGARPALHKKGATGGFYVSDSQIDRILDTNILHVGGVGLMDAMDKGRTKEVMQAAKAKGCITTLDVFASTREDLDIVAPLLPYTDYFMPSEEEARALTGLDNLDATVDEFLSEGADCVILTLGEQGAMYRNQNGTRFEIPAYDIAVVCTCGCGDCFNAGFATGLHLGLCAEDAVRMAQATSAQNAMGLGSQAVVYSLAATQSFMDSTPAKRT